MVRKSSTAPELHLYGSGCELYGPEVLHSKVTASLWFRRETLWSGNPPQHRNCISMVPTINSMVRKSSTAPELHLYGPGHQLYGPKVLHSTRTASLWFRRETLWSGSPPGHWNCISMVLAVNSMVLKKPHTTSTQKGHANQHRTTPCWDCSIPTRIATRTHKASVPQTHTLSTDMTSGHQTTTQGTVTATLRYTA